MMRILTVTVLLIFTGNAYAGISKCNADAKKAEDDCDKAFNDANAADKARSAATQAGSGNDVNQNCSKMANDIGQQQGNVGQAQGKCAAALGKCDSSCQEGDTDAKTEPAMGIERGKISARKAKCKGKISPQMAQLAKALGDLAKNMGEANACKQASDSGKPPQIPPMQPPQKEEKEKKEEEKLACEGDEGARYSDCNAKYIAKCNDRMNESGCETFANRYCGAASVGTSVKNYVADKSGEGLGSGFCKGYTAYKFCKSVERSECPSCRGSALHSSPECQANPLKCVSSAQLSEAKNKCPSDPIFLDPAVLAAANGDTSGSNPYKNNEPVSTAKGGTQTPGAGSGGASGGVGAGGALPGAGQAVGLPGQGEGMNGAVPESLPGGNASAVGSGSAGNYGEGSMAEEEENRDPAATGLSEGVLPASAVEGMPARDVSNQYGPNLFSISTQVYRNLCAAEKLSTCVQRRK